MKKNQNYGQATRFDFNNQLQQQQKNIKPKRKIILPNDRNHSQHLNNINYQQKPHFQNDLQQTSTQLYEAQKIRSQIFSSSRRENYHLNKDIRNNSDLQNSFSHNNNSNKIKL